MPDGNGWKKGEWLGVAGQLVDRPGKYPDEVAQVKRSFGKRGLLLSIPQAELPHPLKYSLFSIELCIVFVWSQFDGGKIDNRTIYCKYYSRYTRV